MELEKQPPIEMDLEKTYVVMNPKQWLDIGNALMVASNQLEFAEQVFTGDPMIKSQMVLAIYSAIGVLNKVHSRSKDFMDESEVSADTMLESIHDQLVDMAAQVYPLLNEEDKQALVEDKKKLSQALNKEFSNRVYSRLSEDDQVVEKFDSEDALHDMVGATYSNHLDGMVDEAFGEVTK